MWKCLWAKLWTQNWAWRLCLSVWMRFMTDRHSARYGSAIRMCLSKWLLYFWIFCILFIHLFLLLSLLSWCVRLSTYFSFAVQITCTTTPPHTLRFLLPFFSSLISPSPHTFFIQYFMEPINRLSTLQTTFTFCCRHPPVYRSVSYFFSSVLSSGLLHQNIMHIPLKMSLCLCKMLVVSSPPAMTSLLSYLSILSFFLNKIFILSIYSRPLERRQ